MNTLETDNSKTRLPKLDLRPLLLPASFFIGGIIIAASIYFGLHPNVSQPGAGCDSSTPYSHNCLVSYASSIGLDSVRFKYCVDNHLAKSIVQNEIDYAASMHIQQAPALFIAQGSGQDLKGFSLGSALQLPDLKDIIEYASVHSIEDSQTYWVKKQLATLDTLRTQVEEYFKSSQGGSLTGDALNNEVNKAVSNQRLTIESSYDMKLLSVGDGVVTGKGNLVLMEFSEYECAACRQFAQQVLPELLINYVNQNKLRFVFRDLPDTNLHPTSRDVAEAARCADFQNGYFKYHDKLFSIQ